MNTNTEYFSALNQFRDNPVSRFFASGFLLQIERFHGHQFLELQQYYIKNVSLNFPIWDKVLVTSEKLMRVESGTNGWVLFQGCGEG